MLKAKYGGQDAPIVVEGIKQTVKDEFDNKKNLLASKEDIANLRSELKEDILTSKNEILKWTFTMIAGAVVINIIGIAGAIIAVANIIRR